MKIPLRYFISIAAGFGTALALWVGLFYLQLGAATKGSLAVEMFRQKKHEIAESIPGYDASASYAVFAPAKTPAAIVERLNAELNQALGSPEVGGKFEEQGAILRRFTPAEFADFLRKEQTDYAEIVRKAGIKEQ